MSATTKRLKATQAAGIRIEDNTLTLEAAMDLSRPTDDERSPLGCLMFFGDLDECMGQRRRAAAVAALAALGIDEPKAQR